MNPYFIEGPALISFSGGKTSAYMLRKVMDAGLQDDVHVVYANTGKEREETLRFIHEIELRWDVPVRWIEYGRGEVDYLTASRKGEPFEAVLAKYDKIPNPAIRFCTQELKIRVMRNFMKGLGYKHWDMVVGIRADEPRRVARMRAPNKQRWENVLPLAEARVSLPDVEAFWSAQPFDLQLKPYQGNCDLCFLKSRHKRMQIIRETPERAAWWAEMEKRHGGTFRLEDNFASLTEEVARSPLLFPQLFDVPDTDDLGDCVCHD